MSEEHGDVRLIMAGACWKEGTLLQGTKKWGGLCFVTRPSSPLSLIIIHNYNAELRVAIYNRKNKERRPGTKAL